VSLRFENTVLAAEHIEAKKNKRRKAAANITENTVVGQQHKNREYRV
jgi:hypothetical protein